MSQTKSIEKVLKAGRDLRKSVNALTFSEPVTHVYNPLVYAWKPYRSWVMKYGMAPKKIIFLGMNPGPWGMAQTGVPFGEIISVKEWMGINEKVGKPSYEHPSRPVSGFDCHRSEVSGRRLWGLFKERFGTACVFFKEHFVVNYCPLLFIEESGRNITPDKLPVSERESLFECCDKHLQVLTELYSPEWIIGVGGFATKRAAISLKDTGVFIDTILHPSPASPAANRGWGDAVTQKLIDIGLWGGSL